MIYNFNRMYYGGNIEKITLNVPDDIKFVEYYKYNEKQQYIMYVTHYTQELFDKLHEDNVHYLYCSNINKFGNLIIGHLYDVQPLDKLPYMTIDELNDKYSNDLDNIYIELYKFVESELNINDLLNNIDKFKNYHLIKKVPIETYHPKKFVYGVGDRGEPKLYVSRISYYNWIKDDNVMNEISIENLTLFKMILHYQKQFKCDIISNDNNESEIMQAKERFNKRVQEILTEI